MCRPEKPIATRNKALRELAEWLRDQRERTRQGYRALSGRAGFHATTLQRAASGESVPKLQTVLGYARACDASPEEARRLWKRARYEETRRTRGGRGLPSPRLEFIRDFVDLGAALVDLYENAGSPALRTMEQRAGNFGVLPRSTAHRVVNKQAVPHSLSQFQGFLRACEVPEADWLHWEAAWTRAWRHEKQDDFASVGAVGSSLQSPDSWFDSPETIRRQTAELVGRITKQGWQEAQARGKAYVDRSGVLRLRVPNDVRQDRDPVQRAQERSRRARRHPPERADLGQLAFPIGEPAQKADALF